MDEGFDGQVEYWNRVGSTKPFCHPVNLDRLRELIPPTPRIVDMGCGYGRVLEILRDSGYRDLVGLDTAPGMIAEARRRLPDVRLEAVTTPHLPLPDSSADAVLLFAVLTCIPTDRGQRAIVREIARVLRPGGLLYISDLWLQSDARNRERYHRDEAKFGTYGVFELDEGIVLRHHDPRWIDELTSPFSLVAVDDIVVETMNGHIAEGFQWFGRRQP